jgi:hypothetical protein
MCVYIIIMISRTQALPLGSVKTLYISIEVPYLLLNYHMHKFTGNCLFLVLLLLFRCEKYVVLHYFPIETWSSRQFKLNQVEQNSNHKLNCPSNTKGLFSFQNFSRFSVTSNRIFEHMHEALNIDKK